MHVMTISTIHDDGGFWDAAKKAYSRLPRGSTWALAVASSDGTRAVNVIVGESVERVENFLETFTGPFARTEYVEADAANAVGLATVDRP
jgi:hypothetical protein